MVDTFPASRDPHRLLTDNDLGLLQFSTVLYYLHETNPDNGLVRDKTDPNAPVSIASVGMALATIPVVVERGVLFRGFRGQDHPKASALPDRLSARVPNRMPPVTRAFSTISWTSKRVAASGNVSFPRSTRPFCSQAS
jgi:hypothetical protein